MGKRLTQKEKEERLVKKVVDRINSIEKKYGIRVTRRGCYRYYHRRGDEIKLKKEIQEKEKQLKELKTKRKNG